jgi:hypothetical protein
LTSYALFIVLFACYGLVASLWFWGLGGLVWDKADDRLQFKDYLKSFGILLGSCLLEIWLDPLFWPLSVIVFSLNVTAFLFKDAKFVESPTTHRVVGKLFDGFMKFERTRNRALGLKDDEK